MCIVHLALHTHNISCHKSFCYKCLTNVVLQGQMFVVSNAWIFEFWYAHMHSNICTHMYTQTCKYRKSVPIRYSAESEMSGHTQQYSLWTISRWVKAVAMHSIQWIIKWKHHSHKFQPRVLLLYIPCSSDVERRVIHNVSYIHIQSQYTCHAKGSANGVHPLTSSGTCCRSGAFLIIRHMLSSYSAGYTNTATAIETQDTEPHIHTGWCRGGGLQELLKGAKLRHSSTENSHHMLHRLLHST